MNKIVTFFIITPTMKSIAIITNWDVAHKLAAYKPSKGRAPKNPKLDSRNESELHQQKLVLDKFISQIKARENARLTHIF